MKGMESRRGPWLDLVAGRLGGRDGLCRELARVRLELAFALDLELHAAELDHVAGLQRRTWPESSRWRFTNVPPGLSRSRI